MHGGPSLPAADREQVCREDEKPLAFFAFVSQDYLGSFLILY